MSAPHPSNRAPLEPLLPLYSSSERPNSPLFMIQLAAVLHPRKSRQRATLLALLSFTLLSVYVLILHCSDANAILVLRRPDPEPARSRLSLALESMRKSHLAAARVPVKGEQIQLDATQELAAVSSFLASLPQNQIPFFTDPSKPTDPQLILDFDTRAPRASEEVQVMVDEVWSKNPVFLYSKFYSPASREVKALLHDMKLHPSPTIIDVDLRDDAEVLAPILARLTSTNDLPILIVGGKIVGSIDDIRELDKNQILRQMVARAGAVIDGAKRKRHH